MMKGSGEVTGEFARGMAVRRFETLKPWHASPRGIAIEGGASGLQLCVGWHEGGGSGDSDWETTGEGGAFADFAFDRDGAAVCLDEGFDDG
jgi:hypothetical protein